MNSDFNPGFFAKPNLNILGFQLGLQTVDGLSDLLGVEFGQENFERDFDFSSVVAIDVSVIAEQERAIVSKLF